MARSINKVTLIGTLGRDPETRFMPNGNAVANINLATDESYMDKATGQRVEQTEWHRIVVYGKLAEIIQQYLRKGSKAYFEGRLKTREWEKDGIKRYTTEIIAHEMLMLDRPNDNTQSTGMAYQAPQNAYQASAPQAQAPQHASMPNSGYATPNYQQPYAQPAAPQPMPQSNVAAQPTHQPVPQHPQPSPAPAQAPMAPAPAQPQNNFNSFDDDIPF